MPVVGAERSDDGNQSGTAQASAAPHQEESYES